MALFITPQVCFELFLLCLTFEWEQAEVRYAATMDRKQPLYPVKTGFTTIDKIGRILQGLGILTKKQRALLSKDRRLQFLVIRHADTIAPGQWFDTPLHNSKRELLIQCDLGVIDNRERVLRNMRIYATVYGRTKAEALKSKYAGMVTKESYFAEIERQNASLPASKAAQAAIFARYGERVDEETR